ncbi:MAG: hypothetical protein NWP47_00415, partial [Rickettsiaceae bacterium]|nr:hypothetical protein [Rickettsiaceae bacterium]
HKFNGMAISTARFITGTSGNYANIQNVGDAVQAQTFAKSNAYMASIPGRMKQKGLDFVDRQVGRQALKASGMDLSGKSKSQIADLEKKHGKALRSEYSPSALIDKARIRGLKSEALSKGANKAVLAEVQKKTGLKRSEVDPKAMQKYREALGKTLEDMGYSKKASQNLAKQLSLKEPTKLKDELAKAKYGKVHKDLDKKKQLEVDQIYKDKAKNLRELARDSDKARKFRIAYANAYADMSDRGIGILGKHSSALRSLEEIRHEAKERKHFKKAKQRQTGEEIFSAVEGVKRGAFTGLGGKTQESSIGRTFFGGAYHDINSGDPRKLTYAETLAENRTSFERTKLEKTIDQYNRRYGENVTSPEFLAKAEKNNHPNLEVFKNLERQDAKAKVQEALKATEETASYGESYLANYAKDSEMQKAIDSSYKVQEELFEKDEFISREAEYKTNFDIAEERIKEAYAILEKEKVENITPENIVALTREMYEKKAEISQEEISSNIQDLQQAMNDFTSSQEVLR